MNKESWFHMEMMSKRSSFLLIWKIPFWSDKVNPIYTKSTWKNASFWHRFHWNFFETQKEKSHFSVVKYKLLHHQVQTT